MRAYLDGDRLLGFVLFKKRIFMGEAVEFHTIRLSLPPYKVGARNLLMCACCVADSVPTKNKGGGERGELD